MGYVDAETGLRNYGTVDVGAKDGLAYEHDPRIMQFWIQSKNTHERVAANLDGIVARGAHVEWFQVSVENIAVGCSGQAEYRIVVTVALAEPLRDGSLSITVSQPGGDTFGEETPTIWLPPPTIGALAVTDIADFDVYRSDVFELNNGMSAPFKFQTWIKPTNTPTDEPRLVRLMTRHPFTTTFDMALKYGKVFWKNVSTTGTQDFRIIVEGELQERFPDDSTGRKMTVNVWQRGGRSFTLATPDRWIDE